MAAPRGVLRWSKREYLYTQQASYSDIAWYRVPVDGELDFKAISAALYKAPRFKSESGYGRLRWGGGATLKAEIGPQPLTGGTVLIGDITSICD